MDYERRDEELNNPPKHITAMPGAVCGYCHHPLPEQVIGNPLWPWKINRPRGTAGIFCSTACMQWWQFKRGRNSCKKVWENMSCSEQELAEKLGEYDHNHQPECAEPTVVPKEEPVEPKPVGKPENTGTPGRKPKAKAEKTVHPAPAKVKSSLKRRVTRIDLQGETVKAALVSNEDNQLVLSLEEITEVISPGMVMELRDLATAIEEMLDEHK